MSIIYTLLVAHFIGDFALQSNWMALNKAKRWDALVWHVLVYVIVMNWALIALGYQRSWPAVWFLLANAAAHFVTDAITSRITSRLWFLPLVGQGMRPTWIQVEVKETRHWFFVAIGADQLIHVVTLFVTAEWWL